MSKISSKFIRNGVKTLNEEFVSSLTCSFVLSAEIKMPSGQVDKPVIEDNRDGTVSIRYDPREEGIHELYVKYNGEHVQGKDYYSLSLFLTLTNKNATRNKMKSEKVSLIKKFYFILLAILKFSRTLMEFSALSVRSRKLNNVRKGQSSDG
jgi:hypothetical protein